MSTNLGKVMGSRIHSGAIAPLAGQYLNDDWHLNTATGDLSKKILGAWVTQANLFGAPGANGAVWYNGTGAPIPATGANGDYYLNDANGDVYTKVAGTWGVIANVTGPAGPSGAAGNSVFIAFDMPLTAVAGDLLVHPFTKRVYEKNGFGLLTEAFILGELTRYGLADGNASLSGPGISIAMTGSGLFGDIFTHDFGPSLRMSASNNDIALRSKAGILPSGPLDFTIAINFGFSDPDTYLWFGLFQNWPDGNSDAGCGHLGIRFNDLLGDTTFIFTHAEEGGTVTTVNTGITPISGDDYIFHIRLNRSSGFATLWIFDADYASLLVSPLVLSPSAPGLFSPSIPCYLTTKAANALGDCHFDLYKIAISK